MTPRYVASLCGVPAVAVYRSMSAAVIRRAPYDSPTDGAQVLHFGVPLSAEGMSLHNDWQTHGMRATGSGTIVMDNVFVPETSISLARPRAGFAPVFNLVVGVAMPLITGVYVGVAERAVEIGIGLARKRANDPSVQWSSGEATTALKVAQTLQAEMVRMTNDLDFTPTVENTNEMFKLKAHAAEQARKAVQSAMDASGGSGFYRANGLERLLRDVRASEYHPLPANQQTFFAGRLALGLDPV